jgi:RHS repeat-associated protein
MEYRIRRLWARVHRPPAGTGTEPSRPRPRRHWRLRTSVAVGVVTAVTAGLLPYSLPSASAAGSPSKLVFTTQPGDGSPGTALASQPVVTIEDSGGNTVSTSSAIALTLTGPGGAAQTGFPATLSCTSNSVAASSGVATFAGCAIDRGGLFTLTATDAADGNLTSVSQEIFVSGPAQLAFSTQPGGGTASTAWSTQPQVTVEDAHGNTVTGDSSSAISLAIEPGTGTPGASLTCATNPVTTSSGVASFSGCAIDKAATSYSLVATDGTDFLSATSNSFAITVGTPTKLVFTTEPSGGQGGKAFLAQPVVTLEDAGGNPVTGNSDQVTLTITSGTGTSGAALTCAHNTVTAVNGVATFSGCSVNDSGTGYTLTATDSAASLSGTSTPFNVSVGAAANIAFTTSPSGGTGGAAFAVQPVVSLTDSGNNPVNGPITLAIKSGTGTPGATLTCALNPLGTIAGEASFSGCSINDTGTGYQLVATSGALEATSAPFDVTQGAATKASFLIQPGNGTGGLALPTQPVVELTDSGGNPAAGDVTLSLTAGLGTPGAKLSCAENPVPTINGVADFSGCAVDKAGMGYSLTASDGAARAQSSSFDISVGPPAQLAFTAQPGGGTGGTAWANQPTVTIEDAGGNQVITDTTSVSLSVTAGTGNGTLTCAANALPAVMGTAVFTGCQIDKKASAYTLTATDTADNLSAVSAPFAVTIGAAEQLLFVSQPSGGTAGAVWATQPSVAVADAGGNALTSTSSSITLSLTPGTGTSGATLSCVANPVPASTGAATFSGCSVDRAAGGYSLTANDSKDGLTAESQPFSVLLAPPSPLGVAPTGVPLAQTFGGKTYGANPTDVSDDVNTATGALVFSHTDLKVAGIGEPLVVDRTYNSDDTTGGSFGRGWSSIFDLGVLVSANGSTATVRGEDGQQLVFTWNAGSGTWTPPPGAKATLSCFETFCTVTRFDGVQWTTNNGQVIDYVAPDGQGIKFSYSPGLVAVTIDTTNRTPVVVDATLNSAGEITKITTPTRHVSYGYSGGLLTSFTDGDGNTWTYSYDASNRLASETDPLGNVRLAVAYDASGRVSSEDQEGSPQHTNDTFTWDPSTQTSTRMALANVGGTLTREKSTDQYLNHVLIAQTFPSGAVMRYSYDLRLNLIEVQDPLGWVQTLSYNSANDLVQESSPISATSAAVVTTTYDSQHRLLTQTDPDGNTTTYTYSGPFLASVTLPGDTTPTTYSYNGLGELTKVVTPLGQQVFTYDAAGNRTGVMLQTFSGQPLNGRGTLATYDEAGDMITSVDPRGNLATGVDPTYETTWTYDADGNLLSETTPGPQTTTYMYDTADDLVQVQQPNGTQTSYSWDEADLTRTTTTGASTSTNTYDPSGDLLTQTSATGQKTTNVYNAAGEEASTTGPDGVTVNYTYDIEGDVVGVVDSAGNTITREYDALSRPIRTVNNGAVTLTSYDPAGNVTSTTDPDGAVTKTTYNSLGKVASVTTASGTTSSDIYDQAGDLITTLDPNLHTTTYTYNAAAERVSSTVNGETTTYGYDVAGNLDSIRDPDGRTTTYTLNALNLPVKTVYTWAGHPTLTVTDQYDAFGRRTQMVDPDGTVHNYSYDAAGNLTSASSGANTFTYNYSTPGEILETYPDGTQVTYSLDDAQNLMSVQVGTLGSADYAKASYIRNANRQTVGTAFSNGVLETDQLNQQGQVTNQSLQLAGTPLANDTFTYDAAGNRLTQVDTVDGTTTTNQYGYDASERLTSFSSSTAPAVSMGPLQGAAGDLMAAPEAGPATGQVDQAALSPASASSLSGAASSEASAQGSFSSGSAGSAAASPAPADAALADAATPTGHSNDYAQSSSPVDAPAAASMPAAPATAATLFNGPQSGTASSSAPTSTAPKTSPAGGAKGGDDPTYTYDHDGNQLTVTSGSTTTTFSYNAADEVTSETSPSGNTSWMYDNNGDVTEIAGLTSTQTFTYNAADQLAGVTTTSGGKTATVSYTYDGDGNRVSETVGSNVTDFIWDPFGQYPQLALEENGSGGLISRFIYGDGPVAMQTAGNKTYFYHLDPLGSVTEITGSTGAVVAAYHYDGFGNVTTSGANPPANPLLFQGQFLDSNTGLYYMRARNYDPTTGRFTQRDPVAAAPGTPYISPYAFAQDRPATLTDPTGQDISATTIFASHSTFAANFAQDTQDLVAITGLGVKIASKLGGYAEAVQEANQAALIGKEIAPETADLAETGEAIGAAGKFLSVVGIGLQTFVTVEDCLNGTVQQCVADAVGTAINIGFTVGCAVLTAGAGAVACGLIGAAIGIGLSYVIANYGPQIVSGLISLADATAQGVSQVAGDIGQGLTEAGNAIGGAFQTAGGSIATGFNELTTSISSGLQTALTTLGYTAVQLAGVLANTFKEGLDQAVAGLISLGYTIAGVAQALANVFSQTAQEAAQILKNAFDYAATAIAGVLQSVYNLAAQAVATILQGLNFAVDEVASALETVFSDTAQAVATILNDIGYGVEQIGAALQQVFSEVGNVAAQILAGLEYGADQIASALETLYNDTDAAVAAALQFAGFVASAIAGALLTVFNDTAEAVASILKGLNFAIDAIASALQTVFNLIDQATAQILDDIGYAVDQIAQALSDVFHDVAQAAATILMDIGFAVDQVATALTDVFHLAAQAVALILNGIGYAADAIATALKDVFGLIDQSVATILSDIGIAVDAIATALADVFDDTAQAVASVLKFIGDTVDQVATALADVFGEAAQAAAQILEDIGYAASDIATALSDVFNLVANAAAQVLQAIGEAASDIASALESVFNLAASAVGNILQALGFAISVIDAIGGALASFGQDVANCFESFFTDC